MNPQDIHEPVWPSLDDYPDDPLGFFRGVLFCLLFMAGIVAIVLAGFVIF